MAKNTQHVSISLKKLFDEFDSDKSGDIDRAEIRKILLHVFKTMGVNKEVTEQDIDGFIKDFDHDKNGNISWDDFTNNEHCITFFNHYVPPKVLPENVIMPVDMIFQKYDKDKNGTLDLKELKNCLQDVFATLGVNKVATESDVKLFFKDYDNNADGSITREDFLKVYAINFHGF